MTRPDEPLRFEEALAELDTVVARLESGDVGLEEAIALFAQGQEYLAVCRERLALAKERIEELTGAGESLATDDEEPF
jgi:exodeoxyribonuclease VII small subunit